MVIFVIFIILYFVLFGYIILAISVYMMAIQWYTAFFSSKTVLINYYYYYECVD